MPILCDICHARPASGRVTVMQNDSFNREYPAGAFNAHGGGSEYHPQYCRFFGGTPGGRGLSA